MRSDETKRMENDPLFIGIAAGAGLPVGTRVELGRDEGRLYLLTPDKKRRAVTHDIVRQAEVLGMGVLPSGDGAPAVKYRLELTDGTAAVLTVTARAAERVEHVLF